MTIRLNKYLSQCGVVSRRKADELIINGRIKVNDNIVRKPGKSINPGMDLILVDNKKAKQEKKRYIILNKPRLYLTTLINNEDSKPTVADLIKDIRERVYPAGRLDYDSEGLVFLTNDGELANKIHHPKFGVKKTYQVVIRELIQNTRIKRIENGVFMDARFIKPDFLKVKHLKNGKLQLTITFHEGRKHLVKNYLRYFGLQAERLKRVRVGNLKLGNLARGNWRDLTHNELELLKSKTGTVSSDNKFKTN